ncbi:MAG: phosphoglycerate dehydrogenase, partial [Proteobacteria bacterium]|nr:phosphoglycerate dehydrogenase [Pseudomonadota bacterium]
FPIANKLLAIGCFSVGTDQVDLDSATSNGVAVFNAPHSSTRSVAELAMGNVLSLARNLADKSSKMHSGVWEKSATGCTEVRGKKIGIVGYGHIGQQVGLLAEAMGMDVYFFDVIKKLPLGRARHIDSLEQLLPLVDFLTLHVPGGAETEKMISQAEFKKMKKGSHLINLSRGKVVDISALVESLKNKHLSGAALDVYPEEPIQGLDKFESDLCGLSNVILTPHIGGSTEEAQKNIGIEVAYSLINYLDFGTTEGAVNFPSIHLPHLSGSHRILYIHKNLPGALTEVNQIISECGANIDAQYLSTFKDVGYLIMDVSRDVSDEVKSKIGILDKAIKTRILY